MSTPSRNAKIKSSTIRGAGADRVKAAIAEKLGTKKPVRIPHQVVLDSQIADEIADAQDELAMAKIRVEAQPNSNERDAEHRTAKARVDALRKKAADVTMEITIQNIGAMDWQALLDDNGITDEQRQKLRLQGVTDSDMPPHNVVTFPPIAIANCAVIVDEDGEAEQLWSVDEVKAMFNDPKWSTAELLSMFNDCLRANSTRKAVQLGKD